MIILSETCSQIIICVLYTTHEHYMSFIYLCAGINIEHVQVLTTNKIIIYGHSTRNPFYDVEFKPC